MAAIYKTEAGGRALEARYREFLKFWPVANEHLRIPTRQGETFVIACGDTSAPPLVLLHGAGGNSITWMADIPEWSKHFRVYAVDVIGEPGLSAPSRPPLKSDAYAEWLLDVFDALSLAAASIVGVSLGGWLALDFATRYPARVRRLVLLCPGGVGRQKQGFLFKAIILMLFGTWGRKKALSLALGTTKANTNPQATAYMSEIFREFRPRREKLPIFADDRLRRLTMPVLLIVGGKDALLASAETRARMMRAVPGLKVRDLPDTGHLITGQTGAVAAFLNAASG